MPQVIDASRISDGKKVLIKVVDRGTTETDIATFLSSPDLAKDLRNHCVPILDVVRDDSFPRFEFLVMPLLRPFHMPPFFSADEMLDFVKQTLEVRISRPRSGSVAHLGLIRAWYSCTAWV